MALKMVVYTRTRDGSQNVGLHENKRWLSKYWFTREQDIALKHWSTREHEVVLKTLVYMRT